MVILLIFVLILCPFLFIVIFCLFFLLLLFFILRVSFRLLGRLLPINSRISIINKHHCLIRHYMGTAKQAGICISRLWHRGIGGKRCRCWSRLIVLIILGIIGNILIFRHFLLSFIKFFCILIRIATLFTIDKESDTAIKGCVMDTCHLRRNIDFRHIHTIGKGRNTNTSNIFWNGNIL